ncbi:TetR/AcrR family transcriptional regulator C-terminal domain-containing protein [Aerococcus mictus]|uniref:TetR/AcrR family transcriptional regulator C-terminal domain-containing protein n=1 Tax=Aerococcus mictus TaxID=2976810 RepID=UPI0015EB2B2A|nr:TetR/AcrR family transcriptional regulator C-terminal domain-containing protein [Aerococcus mictus]MDL5183840.1 TetR/AcrR family transcriptional regulator C-terminal domain-containing protein [Aerococcus mictus]
MKTTKDTIAEALLDLIQEKSFETITITELSKTANISRETFYYHFDDKIELIAWMYTKQCSEIIDENLHKMKWEKIIYQLIAVAEEYSQFYLNLLSTSDFDYFENIMINFSKQTFTRGLQKHYQKQNLSKEMEFMINFNAYGQISLVRNFLSKKMDYSLSEYATLSIQAMPDLIREPWLDYTDGPLST